jgi:biopolymer transport protein ExbD
MHIPSLRERRRARIEIIPLIDIIFFLLATFVMVSLSMVKNRGLDVHLPSAASAAPQERNDSVTITVTGDGQYAWNKETADLPGIKIRLAQFHATLPEGRVFINGDGQSHFQSVVTILDEVRRAGITKVAIQTAPRE